MFAAGSAVQAAGDGLAANLVVLTAGFAANTGHDLAGEVFGLGYQDAAGSLLNAAAAAVNACRHCGALIRQGAANYSNAEAASTLGGGGGVLPAPAEPVKMTAPGPPGTLGPGPPPPALWEVVQSFVDGVWPDGDVAGLHAAAARWRGFGAAASGMRDAVDASKSLFDGQHIPEGCKIDEALSQIGDCLGKMGDQCESLANKVDGFANEVDQAQHHIRDLLHRLGSLANPVHDVMLIIEGDAIDEVLKIAQDINAVLHQLGREARAFEQGIKIVMQVGDGLVVKAEKFVRGELVQYLGEQVGNPVATVFDTWMNTNEGVLKGAVGMVEGLGDLSPQWFLVDPQGAAATWSSLGKTMWKGSLVNSLLNPDEAANTNLQMLKSLLHVDDWRRDRPGLGFGENLFDVATLFAPGAGEAGAAADGAGAAARGAEAANAAGRAGERATGGLRGIATGARGALTDITKTGGDLGKNLEGVTGDLPKIEAPPAGGTPVGLPPDKPLDAPVEATPHPRDAAPGAPHDPTASPGPTLRDAPVPGAGPHDPGAVHSEVPKAPTGSSGPHEPPATLTETPAASGPGEPEAVPEQSAHATGSMSGPDDPVSAHAETPADPAGAAPQEHVSAPVGAQHEPASGSGLREPASVPPAAPHDPASVPTKHPHGPASHPLAGPHEPAPGIGSRDPARLPMDGAHEPVSAPATGTPVASVGAAVGEKTPSTIPQLAEHAPPRGLERPGRPPVEPVPLVAHSPQAASAVKAAPRAPGPAGRETELPTSAGGPRGPGEDGQAGGRSSPPLNENAQRPGENGSPGGNHPTPGDDPYPGHPGDDLDADDLGALADYTGPGYQDLNSALRSGLVDASQQVRVQALKNALAKLPPYQGPVIRGTNLPPEVLDRYRPGEVITEDAFLSTSTDTGVARSPSFVGNVEFRILSKTGRDISPFSVFPGEREVLFTAGTKFYVVSKVFDPLTGRTVIRMVER